MSIRLLRRAPGFAGTVVVTLAVSMAGVLAMFSASWRLVVRPVAVANPDALVALSAVNAGTNFVPPTLSWPRFELIEASARSFSSVAAYSNESVTLAGTDGPAEQLRALRVSGAFFGMLGMTAARGRLLDDRDAGPEAPAVCVLTHGSRAPASATPIRSGA